MISVAAPLAPLYVHQMAGSKWWLTLYDYTYHLTVDDVPVAVTVPAGYRYDRSSIPDAVAWLVSKDDLGCVAPLLHDYLFARRGATYVRTFTRPEANEAFRAVMLADRVRPWRATVAYWAVSLFSRRW